MTEELFFIDDSQGIKISYEQLWRDVDALSCTPHVLVFEDCYRLVVTLLAAIQRNAELILVDNEQDRALAESTKAREAAPHPQPLSPEYRGEGSHATDSVSEQLSAPVVDEGTSPLQTNNPVVDEATSPHQSNAPVVDEATSPLRTNNRAADEATSPLQSNAPVMDEATSPLQFLETQIPTAINDASSPLASLPRLSSSRSRIGLLTSGTTGKPKLVLHAVDSLTRAVRIGEQHRSAVWGLAFHPAHFAGLQVFFQALANRNPIVRLFGLNSEQMHDAIEHQTITHLSATPTLMRLLTSGQREHAAVRHITLGGERSEPELIAQLKRVFPRASFRNVYASTEVGSVLASQGDVFHVPKQYDGLVKIIDGELVVHRSLLAASLQAAVEDDFYFTGDCVEVIQQTPLQFRLVSRRGDFINVGGYKVNPHEVEDQLNGLPEVKESYVYGKPNSVTGNLVCCDVVLNVGQQLTTQELIARLKDRLPDYKIPRIARVVATLPVTSTGKRVRVS